MKFVLKTKKKLITLEECPVGLFVHNNTLCVKTEYNTSSGRIESFIVSSGEAFWGGTTKPLEQRLVEVYPVKIKEETDE